MRNTKTNIKMKNLAQKLPDQVPRTAPDVSWSNKSILIVDDLKVNYLLLKAMITRTGANTIWADNGYAALEIIENKPDISVVLMDYNMPGINGLETTYRIKQLKPGMPVISQSTFTDSNLFDRSTAPYDAYLSKPINAKELLSTIELFIAG
jgi:CheY-like chemotaxis protein